MFKRIKVITLLISVLLVLGIMQVISAGIFINALNNDKDNFTVSQLSSKNVAEFTDAWISLNQARVTLNRGMLRLQGTMASEINGGQLKELVNTANRLLAESKEHYDKYYALPETPGLDEHLADRLENHGERDAIFPAGVARGFEDAQIAEAGDLIEQEEGASRHIAIAVIDGIEQRADDDAGETGMAFQHLQVAGVIMVGR